MRIFKPFPSSVCLCCWLGYLGHVLFHLENYSRFCIVLSMKSFRSVLGQTRFWIFGGVHRKWKVSNTFLMSLITGPTLSLTSYQRHPVYRSVFITFTILLGDTFIQSSLYCNCLGIKYLCLQCALPFQLKRSHTVFLKPCVPNSVSLFRTI